jgi:hypothetical protein
MLLIVLAGAVYAGGALFGAETRARATVWATTMIVGAVIGALIYVVMPPIATTLMGSSVSCSSLPPCSTYCSPPNNCVGGGPPCISACTSGSVGKVCS